MTRLCSKCGEMKPLDEFDHDPRRAVSLRPKECKECRRKRIAEYNKSNAGWLAEYYKDWAKNNPDRVKAAQEKYNLAHPGRRAETCKKSREKHREKRREYSKMHALKNAEYRQKYREEYYRKNRDREIERNRLYRAKNRSRELQRARKYYYENRERHLQWQKESHRARKMREAGLSGSHTEQQWREVCKRFGNRCVKCGIHTSESPLTRDHVIPISCPGSSDDIENIQPLCFPCNREKRQKAIDYRDSPFTGTGKHLPVKAPPRLRKVRH